MECMEKGVGNRGALRAQGVAGSAKSAVASNAAVAKLMVSRSMERFRGKHVRLSRTLPGQGTTEYAILVGVLVVIAILAITVFRPKIQELWNAISDGINGL